MTNEELLELMDDLVEVNVRHGISDWWRQVKPKDFKKDSVLSDLVRGVQGYGEMGDAAEASLREYLEAKISKEDTEE